MEQCTSIKQITIKVDLYSAVILKSYLLHLVFHELERSKLELVICVNNSQCGCMLYFTWPHIVSLDTVNTMESFIC